MPGIPDAPWIRDTELNGMDEAPVIRCPCCGEEAESFVVDENHEVIGCSCCTNIMDPWDWFERWGEHHEED